MASRTVEACPHCNAKLPDVIGDYHYGSPLQTCPRCKKVYVDRRYHEIAVEGVREQDTEFRSRSAKQLPFICLAILAFGLFIMLTSTSSRARIRVGGPIMCLVGGVGFVYSVSALTKSGHARAMAELDRKREESERRLSNPTYAQALRLLGYNVPAKYLAEDAASAEDVRPERAVPKSPASGVCGNCGEPLPDGDRFCGVCGASVPPPKGDAAAERNTLQPPTM